MPSISFSQHRQIMPIYVSAIMRINLSKYCKLPSDRTWDNNVNKSHSSVIYFLESIKVALCGIIQNYIIEWRYDYQCSVSYGRVKDDQYWKQPQQ